MAAKLTGSGYNGKEQLIFLQKEKASIISLKKNVVNYLISKPVIFSRLREAE